MLLTLSLAGKKIFSVFSAVNYIKKKIIVNEQLSIIAFL